MKRWKKIVLGAVAVVLIGLAGVVVGRFLLGRNPD